MLGQLKQAIDGLWRRISLLLARGIITAIDDSKELQRLQILCIKGALQNHVDRFQEYGFTSVPVPDAGGKAAQCLVAYLTGSLDQGVVIATEDGRYRLKSLGTGEVALYNHLGARVHLKLGKTIEIVPSSDSDATKVTLDNGKFQVENEDGGENHILMNDEKVEIVVGRSSITIRDTGITIAAPAVTITKVL